MLTEARNRRPHRHRPAVRHACSCPPARRTGFVRRRWVWLLIFAPLWGTLFINFGLGPILMRTSDMAPILGNTVAFMATASFVKLVPNILGGGGAVPAGPSQTTDDE